MSMNNINPEVLQLMDRLNLYSAFQNGRLQSPQALQQARQLWGDLKGGLGNTAKNIMKGNTMLGIGSFVPDMLRLQYGGMTPQERIQNANFYLQRTNSPARINPNGTWSL